MRQSLRRAVIEQLFSPPLVGALADHAERGSLQVGAELPASGVVLRPRHRLVDGGENFLRDLIAIGGLKTAARGETSDQRAVPIAKFPPRDGVLAIDEPSEQNPASSRVDAHSRPDRCCERGSGLNGNAECGGR